MQIHGREPEDEVDPLALLGRLLGQPVDEDRDGRRERADDDADDDERDDRSPAHRARAYRMPRTRSDRQRRCTAPDHFRSSRDDANSKEEQWVSESVSSSIAVGAILTWAVTAEVSGLDIQVVGVILMIVGLVGFLLSIAVLVVVGRPGLRSAGAARRTSTTARRRGGAPRVLAPCAAAGSDPV